MDGIDFQSISSGRLTSVKAERVSQAAPVLAEDVYKRQVAYCGNVHFDRKQGGSQVDVIQAPRSTGSILKPFL